MDWKRSVGIYCLVACLAGCASSPDTPLHDGFGATLSSHTELSDVPFFPQTRYQCGPAALATVLTHHGVNASPAALQPLVYIPQRQGSVPDEMIAAGRSFGMLAYKLEPTMDALLAEVAAGHPVLVLQNLSFNWWPRWHYAVVIGYDLAGREIILRSGTHQRWVTPLATFDRTWARGERWAVVFVPAGTIPATAQPAAYLRHALELEQTGQLESALRAYEAAMKKWPDDVLAALATGNAAYNLEKWQDAEKAFRQALDHHPRSAAAWNNLGQTLAKLGCINEAVAATHCALRLAPADPMIRESLDAIRALQNDNEHGQCLALDCPVETPEMSDQPTVP